MSLLDTIKVQDRLEFLKKLPSRLTAYARPVLVCALGLQESPAVYEDTCVISRQHTEGKIYEKFEVDPWLEERNPVMKGVFLGVGW